MGFEVGEGDDIGESSENVADLEAADLKAADLKVALNLTEGPTSHSANQTTQDEASKPKRPHLTIVK